VAYLAASGVFRKPAVFATGLILLIVSLIFSATLLSPPYQHQDCSPGLYPEESPNGSSLYGAMSEFIDWTKLLPVVERAGRWNHILPDEFKGDVRDTRQRVFWLSAALLFMCWVLVSGRRKGQMYPVAGALLYIAVFSGILTTGEMISGKHGTGMLERKWLQVDLASGYFSPLHRYDRNMSVWNPMVSYGPLPDRWRTAPPPKHGIFYPPVFVQDFPGAVWPGGYRYRFQLPVLTLPGGDPGTVHLRIENRLDKRKKESVCEQTGDTIRENHLVEVEITVPEGEKALFKITVYGQDTSDWRYGQVTMVAEKIQS